MDSSNIYRREYMDITDQMLNRPDIAESISEYVLIGYPFKFQLRSVDKYQDKNKKQMKS